MISWKVCPSYPDYEVSEFGGLRRCKPNKVGWMSGIEMKPRIVRGYPMFGISVNCKDKKAAEACHCDGSPMNAHYSNLRWDIAKANQADRNKHGTDLRGERHPGAKLTEADVREIKKLIADRIPHRTIAPKFNVSSAAVGNIARGAYWKHL